LLDINMPGMSGLELAQHLKNETDVSFMFLSGVTDEDIVRRAAEYGAIGYLVKPVDIVKLVPTLETGLARAAELKALKKSEHKLSSALAAGRETSMAVGVLIARYQTNRQQAFEMLRSHARSNRKTIQEVANAILDAEESLNQFRPSSDGQANIMRAGPQVARQIDKER
jgi:AmiR/NasT family two-component response regulator